MKLIAVIVKQLLKNNGKDYQKKKPFLLYVEFWSYM